MNYLKSSLESKNWMWDIKFYIALFFVVRLFGITNPPLDGNHGWRQSQSCMVARNLVEVENNPLYPRADQFGGDKTGIFGSEFPLLQEGIVLLSSVFGYDHWYGRLINLIVTSFGIYFFYLLLLTILPERAAFYSGIMLLTSLWFMFGRKIMPDTFSVSLAISGIYMAYLYSMRGKWVHLLLFFLLCTFGGLSKLPACFVFILIPLLVFTQKIEVQRTILLSVFAAIASLMILYWYFVWNPHLVSTYGSNIMFVKSFSEGLDELAKTPLPWLEKFYFACTQSYLATGLSTAGLIMILVREKRTRIIVLSLLFMLCIFMLKVGGVFAVHNYYMIPFAPVFALCSGYFLHKYISPKYILILLLMVVGESMIHQIGDLSYPHKRSYKLKLETIADSLSNRDNTVAFVSDDNPLEMYFSHRKGWLLWPEETMNSKKINELQQKGCALLFVNRINYPKLKPAFNEVYRDDHYLVYDMKEMSDRDRNLSE